MSVEHTSVWWSFQWDFLLEILQHNTIVRNAIFWVHCDYQIWIVFSHQKWWTGQIFSHEIWQLYWLFCHHGCYSTFSEMWTQFMFWCVLLLLFYSYSSRLLHWYWGNHMIAPVPVKKPWKIWVNMSNQSLGTDNITKNNEIVCMVYGMYCNGCFNLKHMEPCILKKHVLQNHCM